ncbi:MAG: conjugal transfer protein TraF [Candidatus Margulisbacteria bacterium]|jgi:hypothetical protein|nr:conjugal transfer protein TraF [Candidatus Margulisiibacteriota bacterium]
MKKFLMVLFMLCTIGSTAARPAVHCSPARMAMGGAGSAVVNKEDSYFYNPAHAVKIKHSLTLPPFIIFPNSIYYGAETPGALRKLNEGEEKESAVEAYRRIIPTALGLGGNWSSGIVFDAEEIGALAIGAYAGGQLDSKVLNRLSPRFEASGYFDLVFPSLTWADEVDLANYVANPEDFFLRNLQIGFTLKKINRYALYNAEDGGETLEVEAIDLLDEDSPSGLNVRAGSGVGLDIGVLGEAETFLGATKIGIVAHNLFTRLNGISYDNINSEKLQEEYPYTQQIPLTMTAGLAVQASPFKQGWLAFLHYILPDAVYAADWDIIHPDNSLYKRLHFGLEQNYGLCGWRMGLNQGYPTLGFNFNLGWYRAGLVYYTEELGDEVGRQPQSYYVLHSSFVF